MRKFDWDSINDAEEYNDPIPGAYIGVITRVEDVEAKEYLRVEWEFSEGQFKGENQNTHDRAGFWPLSIIRSYKEKALPFFKSFKTALEESNPGYRFDEDSLNAMVGRRIGVVLGEEEYEKKKGGVGKRLYVYQTRSIAAIQKGDFTVPELKKLEKSSAPNPYGGYGFDAPSNSQFSDMDAFGEKIPF